MLFCCNNLVADRTNFFDGELNFVARLNPAPQLRAGCIAFWRGSQTDEVTRIQINILGNLCNQLTETEQHRTIQRVAKGRKVLRQREEHRIREKHQNIQARLVQERQI